MFCSNKPSRHWKEDDIQLQHIQPRRQKEMGGQATRRLLSSREKKNWYPFHCGWVGIGSKLDGSKDVAPTGVRTPEHPFRRSCYTENDIFQNFMCSIPQYMCYCYKRLREALAAEYFECFFFLKVLNTSEVEMTL